MKHTAQPLVSGSRTKSGTRGDPEEPELGLVDMGHELAAVVVPQSQSLTRDHSLIERARRRSSTTFPSTTFTKEKDS